MSESREPREFLAKTNELNFRWFEAFDPSEIEEEDKENYSILREVLPESSQSGVGNLVGTNFKTEDIRQVAKLISENQALRERCEKLEQPLKGILAQEQGLGYPTGGEWNAILCRVKNALKEKP